MAKKVIPLRWVSAARDSSGYASAARAYIEALIDCSEIELTISNATFETEYVSHGSISDKIDKLTERELDYKIQVVHLTPQNFAFYHRRDKYNIGYTTWETDRLPAEWVKLCNNMDEIWVPSEWNREVFKRSGVSCDVFVIPHIIKIPESHQAKDLELGIAPDTYLFYSIFQWIERKNPVGLLLAYLSEFSPEDNVCLALKTYRLDTQLAEQQIIKKEIQQLKANTKLSVYPSLRFIGGLLSASQMKDLHARGNCFVLPSRAEGFSLTHAEAMALGKPTIGVNYGGALQFMKKENSLLIDYQETPVYNMMFPLYDAHMTWADPSIMHLRKLMRWCFSNQEEAKQLGQKAQQTIGNDFSPEAITSLIIKRLSSITKLLG
jgi:glycosyltransferase involved in cell wall biosynthesis